MILDTTATVEQQLRSLSVIEVHGDDVELDESFETEWIAEIEQIAPNPTAHLSPNDTHTDIILREFEGMCFVTTETAEIAQFISRAALIADLAAIPLLQKRAENWDDLSHAARDEILIGLRIFLEICPTCAGQVAFGDEPVASHSHDQDIIPYECQACSSRLVETPQ